MISTETEQSAQQSSNSTTNSVQQPNFKLYKKGIYTSIAYIAFILFFLLLSNITLIIDVILLLLFVPLTLGSITANIFYGIKGLSNSLKTHNYRFIIISAVPLLVGILGIFIFMWGIIEGFGGYK